MGNRYQIVIDIENVNTDDLKLLIKKLEETNIDATKFEISLHEQVDLDVWEPVGLDET